MGKGSFEYRNTDIASVEVRAVTPAMAREMLARNAGNRKLSQTKVSMYARIMREGSWRLTHQGIAITEDGGLIDGQHRLAAIVMYGKPVRLLVTTMRADDGCGVLTAAAQPIDIGKVRTISDITREHPKHVIIVRTLIRDLIPGGQIKSADPETVARAIDIMRLSLSALTTKCSTTAKGLSTATIYGCIVLRHYVGIDVLDMYHDAITGHSERLSRAWVAWRERIISMATGVHVPKNQDYRKFVAALTWQVTDPSKDQDQTVVVRNVDIYASEMSDLLQDILAPALSKGIPKVEGN